MPLDVSGADAMLFNKAQHDFEIGSGADFRNEGAVLLVAAAAAVEGGVSGHPAALEGAGAVVGTAPGAYDLAVRIDEEQVAMDRLGNRMGNKGSHDILQDIVIKIIII